jgi:hypothetical protein
MIPAAFNWAKCLDTVDTDHLGQLADAPLPVFGQFIDDEQACRVGHRLDNRRSGFVTGLRLGVHLDLSYRSATLGSLAKCFPPVKRLPPSNLQFAISIFQFAIFPLAKGKKIEN